MEEQIKCFFISKTLCCCSSYYLDLPQHLWNIRNLVKICLVSFFTSWICIRIQMDFMTRTWFQILIRFTVHALQCMSYSECIKVYALQWKHYSECITVHALQCMHYSVCITVHALQCMHYSACITVYALQCMYADPTHW